MQTQELTTVMAAAEMIVSDSRHIEVRSELDLMSAVDFLGRVASAKKRIEEQRLFFTGPLDKHVTAINAMFRAISAPLKEADDLVRGKVDQWKTAERVRIAEQERLNREAAKLIMNLPLGEGVATNEEIRAVFQTDTPIQRVHTETGSASFSKRWTHEIIDELAIPRQWLMVDEKKLRSAVDHEGGVREISGVRIFQEDRLAVSGA